MTAFTGKFALAATMTAGLALGGCATQPYGNNVRYEGQQSTYGSAQSRSCQTCGVVQEVQQVYVEDSGKSNTLGAVIGAVAGGVLGSTVGKGDGRKAATVGGAVAGGVVGSQVGKQGAGQSTAWRIVVRLDDGRYATVTQHEDPGLRNGDYVEVRGDRVYRR